MEEKFTREEFVKIGLNAISQATGEGYGSTTEDDLRVVFDAVKHLISQPSQQSGGVVRRDAIESAVDDWAILMDLDMREELEILKDDLKAIQLPPPITAVQSVEAIHAHLVAQQPPRVDLLGVQQYSLYDLGPVVKVSDLEKLLALPQTEKGEGWISVEERLPEVESGLYLAFVADDGGYQDTCHFDKNGWWNGVRYADWVSHWRPLPSPPQDAGKVKP